MCVCLFRPGFPGQNLPSLVLPNNVGYLSGDQSPAPMPQLFGGGGIGMSDTATESALTSPHRSRGLIMSPGEGVLGWHPSPGRHGPLASPSSATHFSLPITGPSSTGTGVGGVVPAAAAAAAGGASRTACNCKNSRCLKLYCVCFSSGLYCFESCNCVNCYNNYASEGTRQHAIENTLERNPNAFRPKIAGVSDAHQGLPTSRRLAA